jgi:hypothetical protein
MAEMTWPRRHGQADVAPGDVAKMTHRSRSIFYCRGNVAIIGPLTSRSSSSPGRPMANLGVPGLLRRADAKAFPFDPGE